MRAGERWRVAGAALLLGAASLAVYAPSLGHDFVSYDDWVYVVENPNLRPGLSWEGIARALRPYEHNWIPLTWLSLLLDHELHGLEPAGYHATNVALHTAAAVLLLLALVRLTGALGPSAFTAGVFALHPLHVESVAWVAERKDVLSGALWMLCLWLYAGYVRQPGALRYAGLFAALALSLLAKATAVTLPLVLLLLDAWPLRRLGSRAGALRALREKAPLLLLAAAAASWTWAVQSATGAMARFSALPLSARLANALDAYVAYLEQAFWPRGLAVFYPHPLGGIPAGDVLADAAILVAVSIGAAAVLRSRPYLAVGWLWFLGTLVPMIGLVQVGMHARADRYTYVPLVGVALAVAFAGAELAARGPRARRGVAALAALALLALGVASGRQLAHWRDSTALYRHALAVTRDNFLAHYGLAGVLAGQGRAEEALEHLAATLRIRPGWGPPLRSRGEVLASLGRPAEAAASFQRAVEVAPRDAAAHAGLGQAQLELGDFEAAARSLARARALGLRSPPVLAGQAEAARGTGRPGDALRHYREALALRPDWVPVANNLAWLLATRELPDATDPDEALRVLARALAGGPPVDAETLDTLAAAHAAAGRYEEAVELAERAEQQAQRGGDAALARAIAARRALYARGRPYRE